MSIITRAASGVATTPVFLSQSLITGESAWQVNTDLRPLDISEVNEILAKGQTGKVTKKLWQAYEVCAENHDLEYFKNMLKSHYETTRDEERRIAEEEAKRKEAEEAAAAEAEHPAPKSSKKEKGKRKSTTAADKDVDMADAEDDNEGKKAKGSSKKKRKAQETGDEKVGVRCHRFQVVNANNTATAC